MASLIARPVRLAALPIRTQCLRTVWNGSTGAIRAASTTTSTSTASHSIPPVSRASSQSSAQAHLSTTSSLATKPAPKLITARVTKAGYMDKTVRVDIATHVWDNYLRKFYKSSRHLLVHDPANSLREGDMISIRHLSAQKTAQVRHVVHAILVPFGEDIADRPAVPSEAELEAEHAAKLGEKVQRRALRARASAGDAEAMREVSEQGIGVREIVKGRGRSRRVLRVLERDAGKKK